MEKENIIHFVSKKGFNIDGLGEKIVEQLLNEGIIANAADIFELEVGDLEPLERFAEKSAENLVQAIEMSKKITLEKFIYALGIRHVGEETAVLIARAINTEFPMTNDKFPTKSNPPAGGQNLKDLVSIFPKITVEDWVSIKGIGEKSAESLVSWFNAPENMNLLKKMEELGVSVIVNESSASGQQLAGKTFVLTGELKNWTRDEAKDIIRKAGGDISSSVSSKTSYVLAGENPGSKYDRAKKLGVRIINEKEFGEMIR